VIGADELHVHPVGDLIDHDLTQDLADMIRRAEALREH